MVLIEELDEEDDKARQEKQEKTVRVRDKKTGQEDRGHDNRLKKSRDAHGKLAEVETETEKSQATRNEEGAENPASGVNASFSRDSRDTSGDGDGDSDSDDDDLPPLEDMSLRSSSSAADVPAKQKDGTHRGASEAPASSTADNAPSKKKTALKRGFFDAKPAKRAPRKPQPKAVDVKEESIPTLSGKPSGGVGNAKSIPSFMRVEQPAGAAALEKVKEKLVHEMRPTPEMVNSIQGNSGLMDGFDDPEVMAAVAEVAKDPSAIAKYRNKPKVMHFYQNMASMMADKMKKKAEEQEQAAGR